MAERLTEYYSHGDLYVKNHDYISASYKLARYEDLETEISNLLDGKISLDDVCHHLINAIKGEENELLFTRVLTNSEAEKWDKWLSLEEHGRLIELPCAVGDTVWFIGRKCVTCDEDDCYGCPHNRNGERKNEKFLYITTIKQFEITKNAVYMIDTDTVWSSTENSFNIDEIGRTVFLTKEEAQAKLKEKAVRNENSMR